MAIDLNLQLTPAVARERLGTVDAAAYAATRNHLNGAVSGLSPWIVHGALSLREALAHVHGRTPLPLDHRWVQELAWRGYFQHRLLREPDTVWHSRHDGPLPDSAYAKEVPADVREARTGLAVIDQAVRTLAHTGWLHNHARMWLASYLVHGRRVHWRAGADWMLSWLVDGDVGPNHGSWQWVAGTGSSKPYLFNADNVARFAPRDWQVPGSVLDASYEVHEARARGGRPPLAAGKGGGSEEEGLGRAEPVVSSTPPVPSDWGPDLRGRRVWLAHPWALGDPPPGCDAVVALWPLEAWGGIAWRAERWAAVAQRLQALTPWQWVGPAPALLAKLAGARTSGVDHPAMPQVLRAVLGRPADSLFPALDQPDAPVASSFSAYWRLGTRRLRAVDELLAGL